MHQIAFMELWALWVVSWFAAALWTSRTEKRPAYGQEVVYRVITVIGALLLFGTYSTRWNGPSPLWRVDDTTGWWLLAATAAGFLFSWWARIYLGPLWSGVITRKEGHRVVDTGPYRFVRHPIYTGITIASFATAIDKGTAAALLGAAVMTLGWYVKARVEERFLRTELGAEAYDAYARKTAMLVPFVRL